MTRPSRPARARRVVTLQAGDPETMRLWTELVELSKAYFNRIYSALDVTLTDDDLAGESTYNDDLAERLRGAREGRHRGGQ